MNDDSLCDVWYCITSTRWLLRVASYSFTGCYGYRVGLEGRNWDFIESCSGFVCWEWKHWREFIYYVVSAICIAVMVHLNSSCNIWLSLDLRVICALLWFLFFSNLSRLCRHRLRFCRTVRRSNVCAACVNVAVVVIIFIMIIIIFCWTVACKRNCADF